MFQLFSSHPLKTHKEPVPGIATRLGSTCGVVIFRDIKHTTVGLDVSMQKIIAAKLLASSFVLASRRFSHMVALTSESYNGLYRNSCFCYHKSTWCFAKVVLSMRVVDNADYIYGLLSIHLDIFWSLRCDVKQNKKWVILTFKLVCVEFVFIK